MAKLSDSEILEKVIEYLECYHYCLPVSIIYERGYRDGVYGAHDTLLEKIKVWKKQDKKSEELQQEKK